MLPIELLTRSNAQPWMQTDVPGKSLKLLATLDDDRGFVELLRMEPGVRMPRHRHTGDTHVYNLSGSRQLHNGEIVGPGDYVYEPAGCVDSWQVVGHEPMLAFLVVMGEAQFLSDDDEVIAVANACTMRERYGT
jgi:2,4'-dihydroxyacetophenone dioxygenase